MHESNLPSVHLRRSSDAAKANKPPSGRLGPSYYRTSTYICADEHTVRARERQALRSTSYIVRPLLPPAVSTSRGTAHAVSSRKRQQYVECANTRALPQAAYHEAPRSQLPSYRCKTRLSCMQNFNLRNMANARDQAAESGLTPFVYAGQTTRRSDKGAWVQTRAKAQTRVRPSASNHSYEQKESPPLASQAASPNQHQDGSDPAAYCALCLCAAFFRLQQQRAA